MHGSARLERKSNNLRWLSPICRLQTSLGQWCTRAAPWWWHNNLANSIENDRRTVSRILICPPAYKVREHPLCVGECRGNPTATLAQWLVPPEHSHASSSRVQRNAVHGFSSSAGAATLCNPSPCRHGPENPQPKQQQPFPRGCDARCASLGSWAMEGVDQRQRLQFLLSFIVSGIGDQL
jgi:hypothetical protein